jgi:hypothetical protein
MVKTAFCCLESFLSFSGLLHMDGIPHLHGPLADVEILADYLVLFPIFLLTDFGTVHGGGSACTAGKGRDICRCFSLAVQAGLGHG